MVGMGRRSVLVHTSFHPPKTQGAVLFGERRKGRILMMIIMASKWCRGSDGWCGYLVDTSWDALEQEKMKRSIIVSVPLLCPAFFAL